MNEPQSIENNEKQLQYVAQMVIKEKLETNSEQI